MKLRMTILCAILAGMVNCLTAAAADEQSNSNANSSEDMRITHDIVQAVSKDSALSMYAKNVTIITVNGQVTLRGPVTQEQERVIIDRLAKATVGEAKVVNLLVVRQ